MSAHPIPTAEQCAALARDHARRLADRNTVRFARCQAHPSVTEGDWRRWSTAVAAPATPATPSRLDRLAEASWRLHDGSPAVWALLAVIVFGASAVATVGIIASALGWQP